MWVGLAMSKPVAGVVVAGESAGIDAWLGSGQHSGLFV
jgi:hypothetical protein